MTFPKLPNHTPSYKTPITATPLPMTNLSSQSLIPALQIHEYNHYKLRYIYSFTITNLTLLTIRDFEVI